MIAFFYLHDFKFNLNNIFPLKVHLVPVLGMDGTCLSLQEGMKTDICGRGE